MKSFIGNSEYNFPVFQLVHRVEGHHFQQLLQHAVRYIMYIISGTVRAVKLPLHLGSIFN